MYPEDVVLVGVINHPRDLAYARDEHWYRIPVDRIKRDLSTEPIDYLAFFLSRRFGDQNGTIPYFAVRTGIELATRADLIPHESEHPRADDRYYRMAIGNLQQKRPPIANPTHRAIAFVYTTWDRFFAAETIADLYSESDRFVERLQSRLQRAGLPSDRTWAAQKRSDPLAPALRLRCHDGETLVVRLLEAEAEAYSRKQLEVVIQQIRERVARSDGPLTLNIPVVY
ncbi:MAG: hypothetical protein IPK19_34510 [Chloroflexi bacterium]|nr:hypothetical protein [Chloroflexota bacterium]